MPLNHLPPEGHILSVNGFDLYYEVHGIGTPLLLLHGFTGSGANLISLFKPLIDHYQLIVPDLRGHGRSTNPSKQYTFKQSALDIIALLQYLNVSQCNAVGFSGGGCTLLHMATQKPTLISAMSLISATTHFPKQTKDVMQQFTIENRTDEDWKLMRKTHYHGDEQIKMLWRQVSVIGEVKDDMNLSASDLKTIKAKTLIIQGDRDPLYPIGISIDMYKAIPSASLWIVPNAGHVPITENLHEIFLNDVRIFFKQ